MTHDPQPPAKKPQPQKPQRGMIKLSTFIIVFACVVVWALVQADKLPDWLLLGP